MKTEKAFFILEHGSSKGLPVYLEAVDTIKENCVEVVRCKDCKYYLKSFDGFCKKISKSRAGNWFCADGERFGDSEQL